MAKRSDNVSANRGRGRGRGRGRVRGRRNASRAPGSSSLVTATVKIENNAAVHPKSRNTAQRVLTDVHLVRRGRSLKKGESSHRDIENSSSSGGPPTNEGIKRNMFGGHDKYGVGGARYLERGLKTEDREFLDELSASQMAMLYSYCAGKAMSVGWWAAKHLLTERRKTRALECDNQYLLSEVRRFRSELNQSNKGDRLISSKGKVILIDLSDEEDEDDWLEAEPSCRKGSCGGHLDSPPPPPSAAALF